MSKKNTSSFKAILDQANKIKNSETISPQQLEYANITIRVLKEDRAHWQSSAKKEGITMTEIISNHLTERYGKSS